MKITLIKFSEELKSVKFGYNFNNKIKMLIKLKSLIFFKFKIKYVIK